MDYTFILVSSVLLLSSFVLLIKSAFKEHFDLSGAFVDLATYDELDKYMYT